MISAMRLILMMKLSGKPRDPRRCGLLAAAERQAAFGALPGRTPATPADPGRPGTARAGCDGLFYGDHPLQAGAGGAARGEYLHQWGIECPGRSIGGLAGRLRTGKDRAAGRADQCNNRGALEKTPIFVKPSGL